MGLVCLLGMAHNRPDSRIIFSDDPERTPYYRLDADKSNVYRGEFPSPIVHEGRLLTSEEADARAKSLGGRYGWVAILPVKTKN